MNCVCYCRAFEVHTNILCCMNWNRRFFLSSEIFQWKQEREHSQSGWKMPSGSCVRPFQFPIVGERAGLLEKVVSLSTREKVAGEREEEMKA